MVLGKGRLSLSTVEEVEGLKPTGGAILEAVEQRRSPALDASEFPLPRVVEVVEGDALRSAFAGIEAIGVGLYKVTYGALLSLI